jgi:RNA polymerase sigma-70 factor, ECF subfamily
MPATPWNLPISAANLELLNDHVRARTIAKKEPNMDEAAFGAFYAETARPLLGYMLRVSGERAIAEDLMQESYCRFLSAELPPMDRSESRRYLFRIATNLLHDRWRTHKESPLPENEIEIPSVASAHDSKIELRRAFQQLKPRERELLWLAYVEGSNHNEIAECTGLRAASIRTLLFRARRRLLDLLGGRPSAEHRSAEQPSAEKESSR